VDTVIVNADALRVEGERLGMRCRWTLLQNGIEADAFRVAPAGPAARLAAGLDPARPVVGTVGRLEDRKGQDQLLVALQGLQASLNGLAPQGIIVGDGPLRERLEGQARELGLQDAVRFTGTVGDVRPLLAAMDVFVLPSWAEGMSNALMEAMAATRPVVATAVGGNPEIVADDRTGVLVPPGDAGAIASALRALLGDAERADRLARAGRDFVSERFGARARVAELERLYEERLGLRTRRAA
jgi:glycosyltransferase involved in cell wall biosynthesis